MYTFHEDVTHTNDGAGDAVLLEERMSLSAPDFSITHWSPLRSREAEFVVTYQDGRLVSFRRVSVPEIKPWNATS